MKKNFKHVFFSLVLTACMAFSVTGISANAAQTSGSSNCHEVKVQGTLDKKPVKDSGNSNKAKLSDRWDELDIEYISVFPAAGLDQYNDTICDTQYFGYDSMEAYEFSQAVKDDLTARYKAKTNTDPKGWVVNIRFYVQTPRNYPAYLYLKLDGKELDQYPITVSNGTEETISYFTPNDTSLLTGYIDYGMYSSGIPNTLLVSSGTRFYKN